MSTPTQVVAADLDIDEVLANIVDIAHSIRCGTAIEHDANELAGEILTLHQHLTTGGLRPAAWH